jgi:hypothetical protein
MYKHVKISLNLDECVETFLIPLAVTIILITVNLCQSVYVRGSASVQKSQTCLLSQDVTPMWTKTRKRCYVQGRITRKRHTA